MKEDATGPEKESGKTKEKKGVVREYAEAIVVALVIALFLRTFVVEAFKIPSASMVPTLLVGDHLFVNKFIYGLRIPFTYKRILSFKSPDRGEIVVFIYPHDRSKDYIKRVVGIPGDKVEVRDRELYLNDQLVPREFTESYLYVDVNQNCIPSTFEMYRETLGKVSHATLNESGRMSTDYGPQWIEQGQIFVMGDNRDNSSDSRVWGTVPMTNVKGKAMFVWMSLNGCGIRSGNIPNTLQDLATFRWLRFNRFFRWLH